MARTELIVKPARDRMASKLLRDKIYSIRRQSEPAHAPPEDENPSRLFDVVVEDSPEKRQEGEPHKPVCCDEE